MDIKQLHETADGLFTKRSSLLLLWQEQAEQFYPQRADFTVSRTLGTDFAGNLMSSYPLLCQRDLQDQLGVMLRPTAKDWFETGLQHGVEPDNEGKRWLEWATKTMRRAMYSPQSQFNKAMKEGDGDYSCFGQTVTSVRLNSMRNGLLYRCYHLRDCAWIENADGKIAMVARKYKMSARNLVTLFKGKVHSKVTDLVNRNKGLEEVECMHIVCEADMYDGKTEKMPYWSLHYDVDHKHLMEEVATWNREYNVERWQTVSGSQYAFSPSTIAALPEARLLQSMTYTLLEAGEKTTNPPMVGTKDAVRSDVAIYAGGLTWVDRDYDERLGDALRPLNIDSKGLPFGAEQARDSRSMLMQCFYLNKLSLPQRGPEMTAYEIGQRIQEYIRGALPLFEPMEMERNGQVCDLTFEILFRNGAFGSPMNMPKSLSGMNIQFQFQSPLHDAIEAQKGQKFMEMQQMIAAAMQLDQSVAALPDTVVILRDVLDGIGVPAKWVRPDSEVKAMVAQKEQQAQAAQMLAGLEQGSVIAKNLGSAGPPAQQPALAAA
jgi:hypothetical protein